MIKWIFPIGCLSLVLQFSLSCAKWDLEKESFLEVHTKEVVAQTYTSITIKGEISGLAGKGKVDQHGIVWSYTNPEPTIEEDERKEEGSRNQDGAFQSELSDLAVNTPLYARAFARSGSRLAYGEVIQVQPTPLGLSITMDSIRTDNASKVTLFGRIQGLAAGLSFPAHGFVWSSDTQLPTIENDDAVFLGPVNNDDLLMQSELPDPEALKTYYVRAFAISGEQAIYSANVLSFTKGNFWRYVGEFPLQAVGYLQADFQFVIDNQFYVKFYPGFGIYDPETNTWEPRSSDYPIVVNPGAFSIGQEGFVGAGSSPFSAMCWKYSAVTDAWTSIAGFPNNYDFTFGFAIDGKGYMGLNKYPNGVIEKKIYRYEPLGDQWIQANSSSAFEIYFGNKRFVFEDHVTVGMAFFTPFVGFWSYYPGTDTWTQNADFPSLLSVYEDMYTFSIGDKGYLILPDQTDNFWEYNSSTDTWRPRADFPGGPRELGMAFSLNGKGYHGLGTLLSNDQGDFGVWEYIPDSN